MKLTSNEKNLIQEWFKYIAQDSQHYGNGAVLFPNEAMLLKKLKQQTPDPDFSRYDLEMILDWMETNIKRQYGDAKYLMGEELALYQKLQQAQSAD